MKYGLIGPSARGESDPATAGARLRGALEFLLTEADVDRVLYLGADEIIDGVVSGWAEALVPGGGDDAAFLDQVARRATDADPDLLEAILEGDQLRRRLEVVHSLPDKEARVVEMLEGRILVAVYDKGRLVEEDIANAQVLVYGRADKPLLKRFGPRSFYTPGPLAKGEIGVLEALPSGEVRLSTFDPDGTPRGEESLQGKAGTKMVVT